jgi:hypothetical protein
MRFQCNISLLLGRMEARWCVVFTRGSALSTDRGWWLHVRKEGIGRTSGGETAAARLGEGSSAPQLNGGRASCLARPEVRLGGGRALRVGGPAVVHSEVTDERVRAI